MLTKKSFIAAVLMLALSISLLAGCATPANQEQAAALSDTGTIVLRVNPEISVKYNKEGLVTKLEGLNDDGLRIVDEYDDYIGKDCRAVVKDLVAKINDAGYFVSEVDGSYRNITIQIEPGSVLPQSDFLEVLAGDVQDSVKTMQLSSHVVNIGPDDYSEKDSQYISEAKAKEIALAHAGLKASDVSFVKVGRDSDDGRMEYEVEFYSGNREYDYEIDAVSGKILGFDSEIDDDDYRTSRGSSAQSSQPTSTSSTTQYITEAKAKEIALTHAGLKASDVSFVKVERDSDDGHMEYEVEFYSGNREYDYEIDAVSGKILEYDSEIDDDNYRANKDKQNSSSKPSSSPSSKPSSTPATSQYISKEKAKEIALKHAGLSASSVTFTKVERDNDDGRVEYEIEFYSGSRKYEYEIDATSGKILDYDSETDDDWDDDDENDWDDDRDDDDDDRDDDDWDDDHDDN